MTGRNPKPGFVAETPRQEGAQGRLGRGRDDTLSNGEIDNSDANNPPVPASAGTRKPKHDGID